LQEEQVYTENLKPSQKLSSDTLTTMADDTVVPGESSVVAGITRVVWGLVSGALHLISTYMLTIRRTLIYGRSFAASPINQSRYADLENDDRCGTGNHNLRKLLPPVSHGWSVESNSQQEAKDETTTAPTDGNKR
jgi:hypothetical protein